MALVRRPPLLPSVDNLAKVQRIFSWLGTPMGLGLRYWQQLDVVGLDQFPRTGPVIVLPNHVTYFDPFTIMVATRRPIHFMAGEGLFQQRLPGLLARWGGAVPRKKFVSDLTSIRMLQRWAKVGGAVGIFPEAERTWDGLTRPLLPAIGRLVRSFGFPVVTARIVGGYRQNPRWGRQRRGRIRVELDPPKTWDRRADPLEIEAWLAQRLRVDPDAGRGWPMKGRRLAEGLPNVLYRCPSCDALDGLRAHGDHLHCAVCGARWRLDIEHQLHPVAGAGRGASDPAPLALRPLVTALRGRARKPPPLATDGELLHSGPMTLLDITGDVSEVAAQGQLLLTPDRLAVAGSDWSVALVDISTIHIFMQRRLMIRTRDALFEALLPSTGSVLKWQWITQAWQDGSADTSGQPKADLRP